MSTSVIWFYKQLVQREFKFNIRDVLVSWTFCQNIIELAKILRHSSFLIYDIQAYYKNNPVVYSYQLTIPLLFF